MSAADEDRRRVTSELRDKGWMPSPSRRPLSASDALADAWDEGHEAGHKDARGIAEPVHRNPYRTADEEDYDDG